MRLTRDQNRIPSEKTVCSSIVQHCQSDKVFVFNDSVTFDFNIDIGRHTCHNHGHNILSKLAVCRSKGSPVINQTCITMDERI